MKHTNIKAYISFFGNNFNPEELTEIIGISPTNIYKKGEKSKLFPNAPKKQFSSWEYSTKVHNTYILSDVYGEFIDLFSSKLSCLHDFINQNQLSVKIYIIPIVENNIPPALYFQRDIIELAYILNAEIDIDMYIN